MIRVTSVGNYKAEDYDDAYLIVRSISSLERRNSPILETAKQVTALSPNSQLFHDYLEWDKAGNWNESTFTSQYRPRFEEQIKNDPIAQQWLETLCEKSAAGRNIALMCFCSDENLCHRTIIADDLRQRGALVMTDAEASKERNKTPVPTSTVKPKTICFTGHRPKGLCGYDKNSYQDFVQNFARKLASLYDRRPLTFISGGAQGFDQLAFWSVDIAKNFLPESERANIRNVVYVPFRGQESRWLDNGLFGKTEYNSMLKAADEVKYLMDAIPSNAVSALMSRNHAMVDAADKVIALYKGDDWETASGGTSECMRYAHNHGRTIMQIKFTIEDQKLMFNENSITCIRGDKSSATKNPTNPTNQTSYSGPEK